MSCASSLSETLQATLITAAVAVPFVGYSVRGSMPFVPAPRGMAEVVIVGTVLAFAVFGRRAFGTGAFEMVMATFGVRTRVGPRCAISIFRYALTDLPVEHSWRAERRISRAASRPRRHRP